MKKLATFVFALLIAASLSFAQGTATGDAGKTDTSKTDKKDKKTKKTKKSKKGDKGGDTTAAPK